MDIRPKPGQKGTAEHISPEKITDPNIALPLLNQARQVANASAEQVANLRNTKTEPLI